MPSSRQLLVFVTLLVAPVPAGAQSGTSPSSDDSLRRVLPAVGRLSSSELKAVPALDALGALQGRMAGVRVVYPSGAPGSEPRLQLRGATSISGPQDPLVIVDGTILRGGAADLAAQDIERIEVLRGPAASALYGSEGGAGVVLIFTRRGSELARGTLAITVRNEIGPSYNPTRVALANAHAFQLTTGAGGQVDFARTPQGARILELDHVADNAYPRTFDHQAELFRSGLFYSNYLNVAGWRGSTNFSAALENTHSEGVVFALNGLGRQNLRLNLDQKIGSRLELGLSALYAHSGNRLTTEGTGSPFFAMRFVEPHADLLALNPDGTPYVVQLPDNMINASNFLYRLANEKTETGRKRLVGGGDVRWRPLSWLTAEASYHADRLNREFSDLFPVGYIGFQGPSTSGSLFAESDRIRSSNATVGLSARSRFRALSNVIRVGFTRERSETRLSSANLGSFSNQPGTFSDTLAQSSLSFESRSWGAFAAAAVSLRDRYLLDAVVRRDELSFLAPAVRKQWYYRVALGWRANEELKIPGLAELRLHAAYGTAGVRPNLFLQFEAELGTVEDPLRPERSRELELGGLLESRSGRIQLEYTYARKRTSDQIMLVHFSPVSAYLNSGELTSRTHELTVQARLLERASLSWSATLVVDRSRQTITDLSIPDFFRGLHLQPALFFVSNGGRLGELYGTRSVRTMAELYDDPAKQAQSGSGQAYDPQNFVVNEEGYVVAKASWRCGENLLNRSTGAACPSPERPIDYEKCVNAAADGSCLSSSPFVKIGDTNPDFVAGLSSTLRLGGLTVSGLLDWRQGGDIYNGSRQSAFLRMRDEVFDQRGKPEEERKSGDYYLALANSLNPRQYFVESGSYLKLRELAVSYSPSRARLRGLGLGRLERLRVGLIGRNLLTLTNYSGYDPEVGQESDPFLFRADWFGYPQFRTLTAMVEIGF